eukprot:6188683-Pleurochrysis_carterae.AAC.1
MAWPFTGMDVMSSRSSSASYSPRCLERGSRRAAAAAPYAYRAPHTGASHGTHSVVHCLRFDLWQLRTSISMPVS